MSTFKDFFFAKRTSNPMLPSLRQSIEITSVQVASILANSYLINGVSIKNNEKKEKEFSEKVSQLAHSEDFVQTLSNSIGTPKPNESENEFVERSKNNMRFLLKEKLNGS
jgi:hypothetical protein